MEINSPVGMGHMDPLFLDLAKCEYGPVKVEDRVRDLHPTLFPPIPSLHTVFLQRQALSFSKQKSVSMLEQ